ncbi:MAG TPA: protein kinase, partial [Vicinamibacterales bacterium]|nr:protein kinase [Vicinamibacterales bacterium]
RRADIWAFGVVLYEMLTGRRPFDASEISDVLAYVLTKEPDWDALPAATPPPIRRMLRRCLAKDPKERLHDIADARLELGEPMTPGGETALGAAGGPLPASAWTRRRVAALAAVLVLGGLALGGAIGRWSSAAGDPLVTHALLDVSPAEEVLAGTTLSPTASTVSLGGYRTALAWSPDGKTLAFVGRKDGVDQLYLRDLASTVAEPLEGTDGALWPVFSPDGREVAFAAGDAIWKVSVDGGPRSKIADHRLVDGLTWGATQLIFAGEGGLYSVPSGGGTPRQLTTPVTGRQASPHLLPDDRAVLYTEHEKLWTSGDERVMVLPLEEGSAPRVLLPEAADARYLPTGHLAFLRQGTLFVVPFDREALTVDREPTAVLTNVAQTVRSMGSADLTLAGQFAVSSTGTLVYVSRPLASFPDYELALVDRAGRVEPIGAPVRPYFGSHLGLEPDGTRIAVTMQMENAIRLGIWDTGRGILAPSPASLVGEIDNPVWSSRGEIAFIRHEGGIGRLTLYRPDSPEPPEDVADSRQFNPSSWSSDGRHLAGTKDGDVWIFSPDENPKFRPFLQTPAGPYERSASWSPDDQWLAYEALTESGVEVWVRDSTGTAPPVLVSTNQGRAPAWNPSAPELFYVEPRSGASEDQVMMAVDMRNPRRPGIPKPLFSFSSRELRFACSPTRCYAVKPGGQQFYASRLVAKADPPVTHINVVLNWFKDVERKLPQ